ncbi:carbohydrate porin [bacterium AH-315-I18]|nr:carbohydrate porin [bacterium AH-315-I18]
MTPNGQINFLLEGGQIISHNRAEDLSANIGSSMGINDDLDNQDAVLSELYYSHTFNTSQKPENQFILTLGKIDQACFFDANEIANCGNSQFLATPLDNNMAIPFPDKGLGANLLLNLSENFYITTGMGDNHADARESGFTTISDGDFFYATELGFIKTHNRTGNYRLMVWHNQTITNDGNGIAISIDQHITDNLVLFTRWGMGDQAITDVQQFFSAGVGIVSPFGREEDLSGIGIAWANPSDDAIGEETIFEMFYRYQLNNLMHITPSLQAVIDPANATESDTVYVFSLRLQTTWQNVLPNGSLQLKRYGLHLAMHQRHAPGSVAAISCSNVDRDPTQNSCNKALVDRQ